MLALFSDIVRRTRQHHAIEHATIHLLSARVAGQRFSGLSDPLGFTILGDVDELTLRRAVGDALLRLQAGEVALAIHTNCGTNLATTSFLTTAAAMLGVAGRRPWIDKFALTLVLMFPAIILSRPLGMRLQQYTTTSAVNDRWLAAIQPIQIAGKPGYRVLFD
jgi:hypothetical protein